MADFLRLSTVWDDLVPQSKRTHIHVLSGTCATYAHDEGISTFSCPPAQSCTTECSKAFQLMIILNGAQNPSFPLKSLTQKTNEKMLQVNQPVAVIPEISKRNS